MAIHGAVVVESDGPSPDVVPQGQHAHSFPQKSDGIHAPPASMLELLAVIQKKVQFLSTHLGHSGTPSSTINDDEQMQNNRTDLLSATQSLHDLALGPKGILESIHVCLIVLSVCPHHRN
jgi:hypothetical protein